MKRGYLFSAGLILFLVLATSGCASKAKQQAQVRRAYAAGEQAARAQMEQHQRQQEQLTADSQVRILGHVRNPLLNWEPGLTLARALVEADYENGRTPTAIVIYRNNQQVNIDPQRLMEGEDYPLFAGDIVYIQD
ncbi:MAG TPA: hypothetical protein VG938_15075 [Verrucomicrobiae bacterium]|nr:hypothetical protein [Verrucomicrobiae bacterium]